MRLYRVTVEINTFAIAGSEEEAIDVVHDHLHDMTHEAEIEAVKAHTAPPAWGLPWCRRGENPDDLDVDWWASHTAAADALDAARAEAKARQCVLDLALTGDVPR